MPAKGLEGGQGDFHSLELDQEWQLGQLCQNLREGRDTEAAISPGKFAAVPSEAMTGIAIRKFGGGAGPDRAGQRGGPIEENIVHQHRGAAGRQPEIELQGVRTLLAGEVKGCKGVLGSLAGCTAMRDHRSGVELIEDHGRRPES